MDLYYMQESPPCRAVLMVAKHLDIQLNLISLNLAKQEQLNAQFIQLNACHCVPTIVDDGFVLWESRAIITYLADKYSPNSSLYPTEYKLRATIDRLLQFDISVLYNAISDYIRPLLTGDRTQYSDKKVKLREALIQLDALLSGGNHYVTGDDLSLADISILASLTLIESIDYDLTNYANIVKWITLMKSRLPYYAQINESAIDNTRNYIKSLQ